MSHFAKVGTLGTCPSAVVREIFLFDFDVVAANFCKMLILN